MTAFTRTPHGQANYWIFNPIVVLYVEGDTDIAFYEYLVSGIQCKIEPLDGENNGEEVELEIINNNAPYVVCYDGDYNHLLRKRSRHRGVIFLSRYSFENYFWNETVLNSVASRIANIQNHTKNLVGLEFKKINNTYKSLSDLAKLDMLSREKNLGVEVFPKHINTLLKSKNPIRFCISKIAKYKKRVPAAEQSQYVKTYKHLCKKYDDSCYDNNHYHNFIGHFVFSLACLIVNNAVRKETGSNISFSNRAFNLQMMEALFSSKLDSDLKKIKDKLRRQLRILEKSHQ